MRRIEPCDLVGVIGRGRISTIYALADGRALKAYPARLRPAFAQREFRVTQAALAAGAPSWRADELALFEGRPCIVGEHVPGETLGVKLRRSLSDAAGVAVALADANVRIARSALADPAVVERKWRRETYFRGAAYGRRVMADEGLCHGDLNVDNVMVRPDGTLVALDWALAFYGPVVADFRRSNRSFRKALLRNEPGKAARSAKRAIALAHEVIVCRRMGWPIVRLGK